MTDITSSMSEVDQLGALSPREVERVGRRRSLRRALSAFLAMVALTTPTALATSGRLKPAAEIDPAVTAGITLVLAVTVLVSAFQVAWRCIEICNVSPSKSIRSLARFVLIVLILGLALSLVMDIIKWREEVYPAIGNVYRLDSWLLPISVAVGCVALVALILVARTASRPDPAPQREHDSHVPVSAPPAPPDGTIICCSGGGIRSASFCLGGLQLLEEQGLYRAAKAVVGVSGGGYIAAALHTLRWRGEQSAGQAGPWVFPDPAPFAPTSPEFGWLRRHTRFLFDSIRLATLASLTISFGIAVNLFWCAVVLAGGAAWLGWLLLASGGIQNWNSENAQALQFAGGWGWLSWSWVILAAGVALFVGERCVSRLRIRPLRHREKLRTGAVVAVWAGLAVVALVLGLPGLMVLIHDYGATHTTLGARLAYAIGLVPTEVCETGDACGKSASKALVALNTPWASLVATVAAIVAVVRAALAKTKDGGASAGLPSRIRQALQHVVLPWLALIIILTTAVTLMMRWIATFAEDPAAVPQWRVVGVVAVLMVLIRLLTDANLTSLHHFYRERISYVFLQQRHGGRSAPVPYDIALRFSQSEPEDGGPALVTCATANVSDVEYVAADRGCMPFVFDHDCIGLTDRALPSRLSAATYEFAADHQFRDATVPAALAMSGAAFSPLVGREQRRVAPYRFILALANARLGVWLPNPLWVNEVEEVRRMIRLRKAEARPAAARLSAEDRERLDNRLHHADRQWLGDPTDQERQSGSVRAYEWLVALFDRPGPYRLLKEGVGKTSVTDRRLYITDGGHYDNLGLVEALRRRPERVIVLDASNDATNSFSALGEAIATARMDLDCEVVLDPAAMRTGDDGVALKAWARGTASYAGGGTAEVLFAKAVQLKGLRLDTEVYGKKHPEFPRTGTSDQLYGEFDFEAYRQLGLAAVWGLLTADVDA